MQTELEHLVNQLSIKYKIDRKVMKEIVTSQFTCAREVIKNIDRSDIANFKNVRFKNLGLLVFKPFKIKKIKENGGK